MTRLLQRIDLVTLGAAALLLGACGSAADPTAAGQTSEALRVESAVSASGAVGTPVDPVCPAGEKLCTLAEPGGTATDPVCTTKCVPDTALCVAPPAACGCPAGEHACQVEASDGRCAEVCVPAGALCVAPPAACGCPSGEHACQVEASDGKCAEVCVPAGALCIAPPAVCSVPPPAGLQHDYARPDERACPSPACGGYWLVDSFHHGACKDQPSTVYVTGIYAGSSPIAPTCHELLGGTLVPDPHNPGYEIFELEL